MMVVVDAQQVRRIREALPALTKAHLRETLGISETTWVRLRDARPIRCSTYERLMRRLAKREAVAQPPLAVSGRLAI